MIAWCLGERATRAEQTPEIVGHDVDLRRMTGTELSRHLIQVGA